MILWSEVHFWEPQAQHFETVGGLSQKEDAPFHHSNLDGGDVPFPQQTKKRRLLSLGEIGCILDLYNAKLYVM